MKPLPKKGPLSNLKVLDFSTLLPGPLVTLFLSEAGAEVVKIENSNSGDGMKNLFPKNLNNNINFSMINRGKKTFIDIAMTECLFPFMFWTLGEGVTIGKWSENENSLLASGSPQYQIYKTKDDRFLAVAVLEQKFWKKFCIQSIRVEL